MTLTDDWFELTVTTTNVGSAALPVGIGWHPWFVIPSGHRDQARVQLPAKSRAEVDNYDNVFPTEKLLPVSGTPYDFSAAGGAALGKLFLDDNFTDLAKRTDGSFIAKIIDPESHYGLRIISLSEEINAVQIYAPTDRPIVVLEPQFNLADPYSPAWGKKANGMVMLAPGESVTYRVRLELFVP